MVEKEQAADKARRFKKNQKMDQLASRIMMAKSVKRKDNETSPPATIRTLRGGLI